MVANSSAMMESAQVSSEVLDYFVLGLGLLNVVCTVVALPLLEKSGRRTLLLWPSLVLAGTLLLLVIFVNISSSVAETKRLPFVIVSVALIFIYIASFAMGLGPMPSLIVAEVFRQGPRAAAYSLSQCVQFAANLAVVFSFPSLNVSL